VADEDGDTAPVELDLRSGHSVWELHAAPPSRGTALDHDLEADVIIVGAGITGAFLAERLTREGRRVLVLDRHQPQTASTAASTALLQWEIDAPMLELEERIGFEKAAAVYRRSFESVRGIGTLVQRLGGAPSFAPRDTLYFAGTDLDPADLKEELTLRHRAELPSELLDRDALLSRFRFDRRAALLSSGAAEVDPVKLARLLLDAAVSRGARVVSPTLVEAYSTSLSSVTVRTSQGVEVHGSDLILANGYEMPAFVPARIHSIASTWALATKPQPPGVIWPGRALAWEASTPYFYLRTTPEDRIILGGEDEKITDAGVRDALTPAKIPVLLAKLQKLLPAARLDVETAWTGFFGETEDGLPLIGPVPGYPRCHAAFGYGGNGITFSAMAADLIAGLLEGRRDPILDLFAVDRS
jgi:glycine/D-amino acid oxidase-like deaminating enzyme